MSYLKKDEKQSLKKLKIMSKIGRNDSCICGSGNKYKKCCMISKSTSNPNQLDKLKKEHLIIDTEIKTIKERKIGVLCKFHDSEKGFSWGTQRIICGESQIKKTQNVSKDNFIGLIGHLVRTEDIMTSKKIVSSVLGYLPYTETWRLSNLTNTEEKGFVLNFYVHPKGISCRDCFITSFEKWESLSKEEQYRLVG